MNLRNILWNLLGLGLPLLVAALTVPALISTIGTERFGFLALAWGLIGYAGILDLGMGRALTQRISALRDSVNESHIPVALTTAVTITMLLGLLGLALIALAALAGAAAAIPHEAVSVQELRTALLLLGVALPLQALSVVYRGVNEAFLNFKWISILRIALGVANFAGPFWVAQYTQELPWLMATLVGSRMLALLVFRHLAHGCLPVPASSAVFSRDEAATLLRFGGWVTLSGVISPFLVQADRFFVGFLLSASAVTLYVIPYELAIQSLILVGAISTVAFPVIARLVMVDAGQAAALFWRWLRRVAVLMLVGMSLLAMLLPHILDLWVGAQLGDDLDEAVQVGRMLCLGVFFNALASMFYALLHARAQVRSTALLHLLELPLFVLALLLLIPPLGVLGAATAWMLRVLLDCIVLAFWGVRELSVAVRP